MSDAYAYVRERLGGLRSEAHWEKVLALARALLENEEATLPFPADQVAWEVGIGGESEIYPGAGWEIGEADRIFLVWMLRRIWECEGHYRHGRFTEEGRDIVQSALWG